jgi:hypothetical protein
MDAESIHHQCKTLSYLRQAASQDRFLVGNMKNGTGAYLLPGI